MAWRYMPYNGSVHKLRGPLKGLNREDTASSPDSQSGLLGVSRDEVADPLSSLSKRRVCFRDLLCGAPTPQGVQVGGLAYELCKGRQFS